MEHNWGDWYCYSNATIIKVYGFEDTPLILPKTVPNKIAYLEIVRQLDFSNVMHLRSYEKKSFMLATLCFGDFTVLAKEGYDQILGKLMHYNMNRATPRTGFDPQGFIDHVKKMQKLSGYDHKPYPEEDVIRNLGEIDAIRAIVRYNLDIEARMKEMQYTQMLSSASVGSSDEEATPLEPNRIPIARIEAYQLVRREQKIGELAEEDTRQLACNLFISDDQFIKTSKFKSFLYKLKGKALRETVDTIIDNNKGQLLGTLKMDVDHEMETMTLEKGRKFLKDASVLIFHGWDLKSTLVFDSFLHNNGAKHKLSLAGVTLDLGTLSAKQKGP